METFLLSNEQQVIIDEIKRGSNVSVNAVAGSGKTTTVVHLAKAIEKNILQLTYNAALKFEVRKRAITEKVENLEIHSYHSFAVGYYDHTAHDDASLSKVIYDNKTPRRAFCYDIIVIDEAQDMTMLLFHFVKKIIYDNSRPIQLMIMGDVKQAIYEFKGADHRFLTSCGDIFHRVFIELPLSRSYRLTDSMSAFLNHEMLGKDIIQTDKPGSPVQYYIGDIFNPDPIVKMIQEYLLNGYTYEDIFILAPTVKSKNDKAPLTKLENKLVELNIPCFVSSDSENRLNEDVIKGKIVFSTFHQSKGRERAIVFVCSFDEAWYDYFGKGVDRDICPNVLYVAATRATQKLIVIHSQREKTLPFLNSSIHDMRDKKYIEVMGYMNSPYTSENFKNKDDIQEVSPCSVTDLTAYIKEDALSTLRNLIDFLFSDFSKKESMIHIPSFVKTEYGLVEAVSDLNGIAIPTMWQQVYHKGNDVKRRILTESPHPLILKEFNLLPDKIVTPEEHLRLSSIFQAHDSKYIARLAQIKEYNWLCQETVDRCHRILNRHLVYGPFKFEYPLTIEVMDDEEKEEKDKDKQTKYPWLPHYKTDRFDVPINGRVDVISDTEIWELKCVDALTIEHFLQVAIYGWIWKSFMERSYGPRKCYILNMRTNEGYELDMTSHLLEEVVHILIMNKYHSMGLQPLSEWIAQCDSYIPVKKDISISSFLIEKPRTSSKYVPMSIKLKEESKCIQTTITKWLGTPLKT